MDNPDILKQIIVKMQDESTVNFFLALCLTIEQARRLVDKMYWKARMEYVAGCELSERPQADWRSIHRSLVSCSLISSRRLSHPPTMYEFDRGFEGGLDVLLVMFEVLGEPQPEPNMNLSSIRGPGVLNYLVERGFIKYNSSIAEGHLSSVGNAGNASLVSDILQHIDVEKLSEADIAWYIRHYTKHLASFKLICSALPHTRPGLVSAFERAAENNHVETMAFIHETINLSNEELEATMYVAIRAKKLEVLKFILNISMFWLPIATQVMDMAIKYNNYDCAIVIHNMACKHIPQSEWRKWVLICIATDTDPRLFNLVLQNITVTDSNEQKLVRILMTKIED